MRQTSVDAISPHACSVKLLEWVENSYMLSWHVLLWGALPACLRQTLLIDNEPRAYLNALLLSRQNTRSVNQGDLFQQLIRASCCLELGQKAIAVLRQSLQAISYSSTVAIILQSTCLDVSGAVADRSAVSTNMCYSLSQERLITEQSI